MKVINDRIIPIKPLYKKNKLKSLVTFTGSRYLFRKAKQTSAMEILYTINLFIFLLIIAVIGYFTTCIVLICSSHRRITEI